MGTRWSYALLALLVLCGCAKNGDAGEAAATAHAIADHECAACGMVVREQNSPRGQLVHRDGTREFFCSVSDMLTYMEAPSPHGKVTSVFVESLAPQSAPAEFDISTRPWVPAEEASYVLGVDRPRVMGTPILVYEKTDDAKEVAGANSGTVVDWDKLKNSATR